MKNIILLLIMLMSLYSNSQTYTINFPDLYDDSSIGADCNDENIDLIYITTGDVVMNGWELHLRNMHLEITGNLIGDGQIFSKWYENNYVKGWQLDKDLLKKK